MTAAPIELASVMWLLPVVFMLHDFEEIIMIRPWLKRETVRLQQRFPSLARRLLPHFTYLSTSAFAMAVAEEFVLLNGVTLVAVELRLHALWAGILLAFLIHLMVHNVQFAIYRQYVPAIVTSALAVPVCLAALAYLAAAVRLNWREVGAWTPVALGLMVANVMLAHAVAARFERWLRHHFG